MARKSKRTGGHMPLTHYERTTAFASSSYGTTTQRLAGHAQYQRGDCALSLSRLGNRAFCTPSGYLYAPDAIVSYLLKQTRDIRAQRDAYELQEQQQLASAREQSQKEEQKQLANFAASQKLAGNRSTKATSTELIVATTLQSSMAKVQEEPEHGTARKRKLDVAGLKHSSYWLAEAQPEALVKPLLEKPADRPCSPTSGSPELRRKDLWPVNILWNDDNSHFVCAVSGKALASTTSVTAYWTVDSPGKTAASDGSAPLEENDLSAGTLVATEVYEKIICERDSDATQQAKSSHPTPRCPISGRKIKRTRLLQTGGSSFSASGQPIQAQKYRPTIT
jgi:nitric oxide synthase-interacting protein